ncbi:nitroreductase family protein [Caulobacter mirabilis]|uniref:Nitroreductase n=1 Tax=Caulobacter mirabilis TaxID=69666 RepID=A0A2D2AX77_9CAUL|nr:nitroreductase family protein [Caulobacter mirabilis]ATQ42593.1 nitroreductase [Caulobacter mirabilis]
MDAIEALHERRSIRDYQPRPVERALVEAVILDAVQAPSTPVSGAEPWTFLVIEGAERIAGYGARAKAFAAANRPSGPGYDWAERPDFSVFFNAPTVVVIAARADNSQAAAECCRAGQNLMISAHARGLGTCWVGSPMLWLGDAATRAELGLPETHRAFAVFTLGHPASVPAKASRAAPPVIWRADG